MSQQDSMDIDNLQKGDAAESYYSNQYGDPVGSLVYHDDHGDEIDLPIYAGQDLLVGRLDNLEGSYTIDDPRISKRHFRIYSVIYEKEKHKEFPPLLYCEDLESTNGTYVNSSCIGIIGRERVGRLLTDGDVVEIKPSWRFRFEQPQDKPSPRSQSISHDLQHFDDRYTVSDRVLGSGQYGSVYLANEVQSSSPKQLACKIVNIQQAVVSLQDDRDSYAITSNTRRKSHRSNPSVDYLMREIRILSKLSHPNIIDLKKTFCSNTHLYIFTELAPGGDLFSYIEANGGYLSDLQGRVVARQIFLAVQYLHQQGILHRDIKPENVLIMQKDFGGRIVLTDFGFANYLQKSSGRLLSKVGTSGFVAPEVDCVDEAAGGYTTAADIWGLGVLTTCILTGHNFLPHEEFTQNSQKDIAALFMGPHDQTTKERWHQLSQRALHFLHGLIAINPQKRMTVDQALKHPWFTQPATEAKLMEEGYQRIIRFWRKRDDLEQVMEDLPGRTPIAYVDAGMSGSKSRKRIPDASSSPYFGLDRHLNQKLISKRKNILDEVNSSGGRFLKSDTYRKTAGINTALGQSKRSIESVDGRDIFGTSQKLRKGHSSEIDSDEVDFVPTTPIPRVEKDYGFNLSDAFAPNSQQNLLSLRPRDAPTHKRVRIESENIDERNMRDEVAKSLPKYSSAKLLKDEVAKKKMAQRLEKEMAGLRVRHGSNLKT